MKIALALMTLLWTSNLRAAPAADEPPPFGISCEHGTHYGFKANHVMTSVRKGQTIRLRVGYTEIPMVCGFTGFVMDGLACAGFFMNQGEKPVRLYVSFTQLYAMIDGQRERMACRIFASPPLPAKN